MDKIKRQIILPVALQFVVLCLFAFLNLDLVVSSNNNDLKLYYASSLNVILGQFPYRDFPIEYPPLALLPMVLPQLLNFKRSLGISGYAILFSIENALFSTVVALLLWQISSGWQSLQRSRLVVVSYGLLAIITAPVLLWRYDLFPALLTQLAFLGVIANRPSLAGIGIGLGIAAKLYPAILLPIFSLYYLVKREYSAFLRSLIASTVTACLVLLPFALVGSEGFFNFLSYHKLRGIQLETLPAGVILLAHKLGWTEVEVIFNYGAFHLVSPLADSVLKGLPLAFLLLFGLAIISCFHSFRMEQVKSGRVTTESLAAYIVAVLLIFIATNKVFSAQYMIWLLPFAPLLRLRQQGLFMVICAITIVLYPFLYDQLSAIDTIPILLLNLRNVLIITLIFWLILGRSLASAHTALVKRDRLVD